jgi:ribosome biogenesis protein UTP30
LGKVFYEKKKFPFPIDCQEVPESLQSKFSTYEEYINDLGNHTYFMMGNGPV